MPSYIIYLTIDPDPDGSKPMTGAQHNIDTESPERAIRFAAALTNKRLVFPATIIAASASCVQTGECVTYNVKRDGLPKTP